MIKNQQYPDGISIITRASSILPLFCLQVLFQFCAWSHFHFTSGLHDLLFCLFSTSRSIPILTHPVSTWETIGLSCHFLLFVTYIPRPNKSHLTSQVLLPLCRRVEDCPGTWCCCCSPTDGASRQSDLLPSFTAKCGIFTTYNGWSALTMFTSKL